MDETASKNKEIKLSINEITRIIDERPINAGGITIRKKNSQHKSLIELQRSMKEQIEGIYGVSKIMFSGDGREGVTLLACSPQPPSTSC